MTTPINGHAASWAGAWHVLAAAAAGDPVRGLTTEEAQALRAELWDARGEAGRLKAAHEAQRLRSSTLETEAKQLMGQLLSEEAHRVEAQARASAAEVILRGVVEGSRPMHFRTLAERWLRGEG
jgi:hypothetical protein